MAITLSSGRITLTKETGVGDSWANAYTIESIYNAAVAGSWAGVTKTGSNVYSFENLSIYVNTATYLKITNSVINFIGDTTDTDILTKGAGYLQLGENTAGKLSAGCILYGKDLTTATKRVNANYAYATTVMYNFRGVTFDVANGCNIVGGGTEINYNAVLDVSNTHIINCNYGIRSPLNGSNFDNLFINNCIIGVWLYAMSGTTSLTLRNLVVQNNTTDIRNQSSANACQENTFLNCIFDSYQNYISGTTTADSYCIFNVDEYFNVKVVDEAGDPISGAAVNLYNKDDDLVVNTTTDSGGLITQQEVRRLRDAFIRVSPSFVNQQTITDYNPFTLEITKDGYESYGGDITIDAKTNIKITLKTALQTRKSVDGKIFIALNPEQGSSSNLLEL